MKYEIINPSDKVYITAKDDLIAKIVCYYLGRGTYMLKNDKGELLTGFLDPNINIETEELEKYIVSHVNDIAETFDSLTYEGERTSMNNIGKSAYAYATAFRAAAKYWESEGTVGIDLANGSDFTSEGNAKTVNKTEGEVIEP